MSINWIYPERRERVVNGRARRESYYGVTCDRCNSLRWLRAADARKVERRGCICFACAQGKKGVKGYAATVQKYGEGFALDYVRQYRLANPSCLEIDVMAVLDDLNVRYQREVKVGGYLVDFVVDGEFAIEVNGTYAHSHDDRQKERDRCARIEQEGYRLLIIDEPDVPDAASIIARFINLEPVAC